MTTEEKLDRYYVLENANNDRIAILDNEKSSLIDSVYTPEIRQKVEEINAEFADKYRQIENDEISKKAKEEMSSLKKQIEKEVIEKNESIKGTYKIAVLTKEKKETTIEVDTGMLKGMTVDNPKLQSCWKEVEVTTPAKVVIRKK